MTMCYLLFLLRYLFTMELGHWISQTGEAFFNVISTLSFQSIVMSSSFSLDEQNYNLQCSVCLKYYVDVNESLNMCISSLLLFRDIIL